MAFFELVLAGLIIGVFVGVSGVGGGSIMTPVLMLLAGMNPLAAVGTDLLYSVPTKIFGAVLHARQRTLDWGIVRALLYGGVPGAIAGVLALWFLRHNVDPRLLGEIVKRSVAAALMISAAMLIYGIFVSHEEAAPQPPNVPALCASGAAVGFLVAFTSIGSGAITLPLLLLFSRFTGLRRLVGSDIAFAAFLIPLAAAGHAAIGDVNYRVVAALLAGSLPGVFVGSRLCKNLPEAWLRPAVAMVLVLAGARML